MKTRENVNKTKQKTIFSFEAMALGCFSVIWRTKTLRCQPRLRLNPHFSAQTLYLDKRAGEWWWWWR
jgi:hypothetical protein